MLNKGDQNMVNLVTYVWHNPRDEWLGAENIIRPMNRVVNDFKS